MKLRSAALEWRAVEGEVVALDLRGSVYLGVNRTGAVLWPRLVTGATRDQLAAQLVSEFAIERPQAEREVDAFIEELRRLELLEGE